MSEGSGAPAQQRQFFRAHVDFPVTTIIEGETVSARAHDLSGAGIRISTERMLDNGRAVEMRFHLPSGKSELRAHGVVVLSFFEGSTQRYHHGIAFTHIGAADREAIVHHVHDVQRHTPRSENPS